VLAALQERLMDPALLEEFCAEYTAHLNRLRGTKNASRAAAKAALEKLTREKERLIQAIKDGMPASEVKDDLAGSAARRDELEALIEGTTESRCCCIRTWRRTIGPRSRTSHRH
jgi:site-specific DNA recombinase